VATTLEAQTQAAAHFHAADFYVERFAERTRQLYRRASELRSRTDSNLARKKERDVSTAIEANLRRAGFTRGRGSKRCGVVRVAVCIGKLSPTRRRSTST
jgi:hypothetical protein